MTELRAEHGNIRKRNAARELYLTSHPEAPADLRRALEKSEACVGMTREMVVWSLGDPHHSNTLTTSGGVQEQMVWDYPASRESKVVLVAGGRVVSVEERR